LSRRTDSRGDGGRVAQSEPFRTLAIRLPAYPAGKKEPPFGNTLTARTLDSTLSPLSYSFSPKRKKSEDQVSRLDESSLSVPASEFSPNLLQGKEKLMAIRENGKLVPESPLGFRILDGRACRAEKIMEKPKARKQENALGRNVVKGRVYFLPENEAHDRLWGLASHSRRQRYERPKVRTYFKK
jgi:hypothetical protein